MPGYNHVLIVGNLVRDPIFFISENNVPVCKLIVATNDRAGSNGAYFATIVTRNQLAEMLQKNARCGMPVLVEGTLRGVPYCDAAGKTQIKTQISAKSVQFLSANQKNISNEVV